MEPISTALMVGLPVLFGLLGDAFAAGDREEAERIRQQIADLYGPEALAEADRRATVGPSAMGRVQADPQAVAAQRLALRRLQEDAETVGLTDAERAEMAAGMDEAAQYERGQRGAILADAQRRGVGGSGVELAAQLQAQQGGAMRANRAGLEGAAMAARRRALANMQMGQFGGQMRGQGFEEDSAKARAADEIARFNAQMTTNNFWSAQGGKAQAKDSQARAKEGSAQNTQQTWAGVGAAGGHQAGVMAGQAWEEEMLAKYGPGWRGGGSR